MNFWIKFVWKGYVCSKKKSEHHHWIPCIGIRLGSEFQVKLTILIFRTKFGLKRYFRSKREKVNTTMEFWILELFLVPNFSLSWKFWFFGPNLLWSKTEKTNITTEFCIFELVKVPILNLSWQVWFFAPNLAKKGTFGWKRKKWTSKMNSTHSN